MSVYKKQKRCGRSGFGDFYNISHPKLGAAKSVEGVDWFRAEFSYSELRDNSRNMYEWLRKRCGDKDGEMVGVYYGHKCPNVKSAKHFIDLRYYFRFSNKHDAIKFKLLFGGKQN